MIRIALFTFFTVIVSGFILTTPTSAAVTGFQPGRIIDDMVFTNTSTMTPTDIQMFLNSKMPVCDTWGTQPYGNTTRAAYAASRGYSTPFTCLKDYSENGRSAAQIIYDVGQQFRINPQVLIVLLQKEQALITDDWPWSIQYRSATGYGCPDTADCDSQYYGFANQVTWAAKMFRRILDNDPNWYTPYILGNNYIQYSPDGSCGGSVVNVQNRSTQALYNYTPYQPNPAALDAEWGTAPCGAYGNRNFYLYFTSWFGVTTGTSLVQAPSSSTVYLLSNSKRFAIPNGDIIYAYGMETTRITAVSDQYLSSVPDGGLLSPLFTLPNDGTVYLADGGRRIAISSGSHCVDWGLQCGNTALQHELGSEIKNRLQDGGILQPIMKFQDNYYLMQAGKKQQFIGAESLTERGYASANSTVIKNWTTAIRPFGFSLPRNNSFIKFASSSAIYFYANQQFFGFKDFASFTAWIGQSSAYLDSTSLYNSQPPAPALQLSTLVTNQNMGVRLLTPSKTYHLTGATNVNSSALDISTYPALGAYVLAKPTTSLIENTPVAIPGGTILVLKQGNLRPIPTMIDLRLQYNDSDIVSLPSTILDAYPVGKLAIPSGRVVKPSEGGAMYVYGSDKNLWALGSLSELNAVTAWVPGAVQTKYENIEMAGIKVYSGLATIGTTSYIVTGSGTIKYLDSNVLSINKQLLPLDGVIASRIKIEPTPASFIAFDNGTIFHITSGMIRPIASLSAYYRLGGTASNTVSLPLKALSNFVVGEVTY